MLLEPIEKIEITKDDITNLKINAVVNSATPDLLSVAGTNGKIHKVAGPKLKEECATLNGCMAGHAKITDGYNLPAKRVIHTVGPIYIDGKHSESVILTMCYKNCLKLLNLNGLESIAFPSISSGDYGFPVEDACAIALRTVLDELEQYPKIKRVVFCCYTDKVYEAYQTEFTKVKKEYSKKNKK